MKGHLEAICKAQTSYENEGYSPTRPPSTHFSLICSPASKAVTTLSKDFSNALPEVYFQKYVNIIMSVNLEKQVHLLNDCVHDLEQQYNLKTSIQQWKKILKARESIVQHCEERLVKNACYRNAEIKQGIELYIQQYKLKYPKEQLITISFESSINRRRDSNFVRPLTRIRPKTTTMINHLAKSTAMQRKRKIDSEFLECCELSKFNDTNVQQNSLVVRENAMLNLTQQLSPKINFFDQNPCQFTPSFISKSKPQQNWSERISPSKNQLPQAEQIRDRLKLLNCDYAVTFTRQQSYRKKVRKTRIFSSIFG